VIFLLEIFSQEKICEFFHGWKKKLPIFWLFFKYRKYFLKIYFSKFFMDKIDKRKKTEFMVKKTTNSAKKIV
jgi:hypothetical protein